MSDRKIVGIFGGSFDPPHIGHRNLVSFYLSRFSETEKLLIVPNKVSPFKKSKYFEPDEIWKLVQLNFLDIEGSRIELLDFELKKDTPSYSYETILEAKRFYPTHKIDLILGEDQFLELPRWKEFEIILQEVDRFVIYRRFHESEEPIRVPQPLLGCNIYIMDNPLWEESSSRWRKYPKSDMIYPDVLSEMKRISSERYNQDCMETWKEKLKEHVTDSRFDHTLLVSKIAKELATTHCYIFPEKMELAGILHDITKQKSRDFHIALFRERGFDDYYSLPMPAYHAFSASFLLEDLGIKDIDILSSIKNHTLGKKDMSLPESILYTADYLGSEYARQDPDYNLWLHHVSENIEFGNYLKSKNTIMDLSQKNKPIHINTVEVYNQSLEYISQE